MNILTKKLTHSNLKIFNFIFDTEISGCTKESIHKYTLLPLKTIENILTTFFVDGIIFMKKCFINKIESQYIFLTDKGTQLASYILSKI